MKLRITPKVETLIQQQMNTRRYKDHSDLISAALHAFADRRHRALTDPDAMIQLGIDPAGRAELHTQEETCSNIAGMRAKL